MAQNLNAPAGHFPSPPERLLVGRQALKQQVFCDQDLKLEENLFAL